MADNQNTSGNSKIIGKRTVLKKSEIHPTKELAMRKAVKKKGDENEIDELMEQIASYIVGE